MSTYYAARAPLSFSDAARISREHGFVLRHDRARGNDMPIVRDEVWVWLTFHTPSAEEGCVLCGAETWAGNHLPEELAEALGLVHEGTEEYARIVGFDDEGE